MKDNVKALLSRMHKTKGARFAAHKRFEKKGYYNAFTVSILSFYVICISCGLIVFRDSINEPISNWLTFISVSLSVFIIIITLLDKSERFDVKGESMHNCAREILDLYNRLSYESIEDSDKFEEYRRKYNEIIYKYPFNHDDIDRYIYLSETPHDSETKIRRPIFKYFWNVFGMNSIYLILPLLLIILSIYMNTNYFDAELPLKSENSETVKPN